MRESASHSVVEGFLGIVSRFPIPQAGSRQHERRACTSYQQAETAARDGLPTTADPATLLTRARLLHAQAPFPFRNSPR